MARILIVGCGDIGIPLGVKLSAAGHQVWGLRRTTQIMPPLHPLIADVSKPETLRVLKDMVFDYVVVTLTPSGFSDQAYQSVYVDGMANVLAALVNLHIIKRVFYVSSTSVYHQSGGQWVNESSPTLPQNFSGRRLLQAEQLIAASAVKYTIIRFAGIYGPGRTRLIEQVKSLQGCPRTPALYTNRIHRDDCIGFLAHLISMDLSHLPIDNCYIGVDSEPVPMWTVKFWLAKQLGIDPKRLSNDTVNRRSSKRCSNQRLLATAYSLQYSNFQQGYQQLLLERNK